MNILRSRLGLMAAAVGMVACGAAFSSLASAADRPDDRVDKVLVSHNLTSYTDAAFIATAYDADSPAFLGAGHPPAAPVGTHVIIHVMLNDDLTGPVMAPLEVSAYPTGWSPALQRAFLLEPQATVAPAERYNC